MSEEKDVIMVMRIEDDMNVAQEKIIWLDTVNARGEVLKDEWHLCEKQTEDENDVITLRTDRRVHQ